MPSTVWSAGLTARRGKEVLRIHEPGLVCVANRPTIIQLLNEAEYEVKNFEVEEDVIHRKKKISFIFYFHIPRRLSTNICPFYWFLGTVVE